MPPAPGRFGGDGEGFGVGVDVEAGGGVAVCRGAGEFGGPAVGVPQPATNAASKTDTASLLMTTAGSSAPACRIAQHAPSVPGRRPPGRAKRFDRSLA